MIFIVAGMGGGTGTGAAPVVAKLAKELGILTVGVVTKPLYFEGKHRTRQAEAGINVLTEVVDSLIEIPNDNLKFVANEKLTFNNALAIADDVLAQTVNNLVEVIQRTAVVNCDFADIRSTLRDSGRMHTATGFSSGTNRADSVIEQILKSKLLGTSAEGANSVLLCIKASGNIGLEVVDRISTAVSERVAENANIIFGMDFDNDMEMKVVLIATSKAK